MGLKLTPEEMREQYEARILQALGEVAMRGFPLFYSSCVQRLTDILNEVAMHGYMARLVTGPDGYESMQAIAFIPADNVSGFAAATEMLSAKNPCNPTDKMKPICDMTDRELLRHFANLVCCYDRKRDDELDYLSDHPNRDAWTAEEEDRFKELSNDVTETYVNIRRCIDHINTERRP